MNAYPTVLIGITCFAWGMIAGMSFASWAMRKFQAVITHQFHTTLTVKHITQEPDDPTEERKNK